MEYRTAIKNDLENIFNLQHSIFNGPCAYSRRLIDTLIKQNNILVAINNRIIVGFIMFMVTKHQLSDEKVNTIISLGVEQNMRSKGIGKNLLLLNRNKVYLHVRVDNLKAISLYTHVGFKIISVINNYYPDCDAYYMSCEHKS